MFLFIKYFLNFNYFKFNHSYSSYKNEYFHTSKNNTEIYLLSAGFFLDFIGIKGVHTGSVKRFCGELGLKKRKKIKLYLKNIKKKFQ